MSTTVKRVLRAYEKSGETLLQELPLNGIPLTKLQKLFGYQADNPMYDCYLLPPEHLPWLEKYVVNQSDGQLDSHSYDYFLECDRA
jgi:hypothetical protein